MLLVESSYDRALGMLLIAKVLMQVPKYRSSWLSWLNHSQNPLPKPQNKPLITLPHVQANQMLLIL